MRDVKNNTNIPVVAYNVSGEYAMTKAAAINGWIDEEHVVMETNGINETCSVDMIITYFAKDICRYLDK